MGISKGWAQRSKCAFHLTDKKDRQISLLMTQAPFALRILDS